MENPINRTNCPNNIAGEPKAIKLVEDAVNNLYNFQERYFDNHTIEEAAIKIFRVKDVITDTLKTLEEHKDAALKCSRAKYYYQLGRVHNLLPSYSFDAEEALAKAVKLDPHLVPAWNELGECYWKRDNIYEAKMCFEKALVQNKNKVSLRNLSMLLRQEPCKTPDQKVKNVDLGVDLARQAVQLDTTDGASWSVLGNAYLAAFFAIKQNPRTLKQAMSAYAQAAHKYEEEYKQALMSFNRAIERDPSWESPKNKQMQLLTYLNSICDMIENKGKLKIKKINSLLQGLDNKHLGPYDGGLYTAASGQSCRLELIHISQLKDGLNSEKVIIGKVICSVNDEDSVPFTFCMMDKEQTVVSVTVYNLAQGTGVIIGDSVAVPEPYLTHFSFNFSGKDFKFNGLRVDSPLVLVVNGKKLGRDKLASTQLSTFKMAHY
ncbi:tetratricopeptide repeat protein 5-like isoform X2 [Lycorma delicatula]|uniref:tetratricopeptide repeat protein 5-like isoform X2 n=1 Tax=Lycorma delicatula TaxID=130591 RepID=UPI003F51122F